MAAGEFSLIDQYFARPARVVQQDSVLLGIGDDAAVLRIPENHLLVQTLDTLIAGRHFPESTSPEDIAYKSLAVNVSDLAAMAATPWSFLLSLTLPQVEHDFLHRFSSGLFSAADEFGIQLVGGDTCKGPLSISIQANGVVKTDEYVTRQRAKAGDHILVSGCLGAAAMGLSSLLGHCELSANLHQTCMSALNRPAPRIDLIPLLGKYASAAIDISDGLSSDLGHILQQSKVGAEIYRQALPVPEWIIEHDQYQYALSGGDDYQIVFTVPEQYLARLMAEVKALELDITEIGLITESGYWLQLGDRKIDLHQYQGFNHFGQ
jgi:thiamine-monophosphate kinase